MPEPVPTASPAPASAAPSASATEPVAASATDQKATLSNPKKYKISYFFSQHAPPKGTKFSAWFNDKKRRGSLVILSDVDAKNDTKKIELTRKEKNFGESAFGAVKLIADESDQIQLITKAPVEGALPTNAAKLLVLPDWEREESLMKQAYPQHTIALSVDKEDEKERITWRLVMPYLGDYSLREAIEKYPAEKFDIFMAALVDLKRLHELGIVHGDVKSNNIRMKKVDGKWQAFYIDFGAAYEVGKTCRTVMEICSDDVCVEYLRGLSPDKARAQKFFSRDAIELTKKVREKITSRVFSTKVEEMCTGIREKSTHYSAERFCRPASGEALTAKFEFDVFAFVRMLYHELKPEFGKNEVDFFEKNYTSLAEIDSLINKMDQYMKDRSSATPACRV
jgi:tRNA A-37 threonylcarbamoyl transferase component Bud32